MVRTDPAAEGDGLRLRHTMPTLGRSSEDEEEEEEEFQLAERREEKQGFSLNKLIVGALVLLCLGSLFFSGLSYLSLSCDQVSVSGIWLAEFTLPFCKYSHTSQQQSLYQS